jgi:hypothetical protein
MVGAPATPLATISPAKASTPSRSTGNDTGSPISPRSPLVSQTRLLTLPGSTTTTSDVAGTVWRSSSTTSHLLTNRKGPCLGKSLTTKVAQELSAERLERSPGGRTERCQPDAGRPPTSQLS